MKTIFTICALIVSSSMAFGQLNKGDFLAGGSFTFSTGKTKNTAPVANNTSVITETKHTNINFSPKFGVFVADNLAIGAQVGLESYSVDGNLSHSTVSAGPFIRYYFPVKIFAEGFLGYAGQKFGDGSGASKYNGLGYSAGLGYALFLNKNVALEPMVKFVGYSTKNAKDSRYKNSDAALLIGIGFQIYF